jgi:putative component of membrane protein insertase Oxa1/YidC/SpoIIIJ protein YidD
VRATLLLLFVSSLIATGQVRRDDLHLISSGAPQPTVTARSQPSYVFKESNWFIKCNPVSLLFGGALLVYQRAVSPQIMQGCAFEPSCSNFSKQCIRRFGLAKGVALSTDRLTRCTRLSAIDFHPALFNSEGKVKDSPEFYSLK